MSGSTGQLEVCLFSADRLEKLTKWDEIKTRLEVEGLFARPLRIDDYDNGYLELLSQLTHVGQISKDQFEERFKQMQAINSVQDHYAIVVIIDKSNQKVVGASTFFLEYKFIHQCATRGRLEDVAVLNEYRGRHIGELIVRIIVELARESFGCYKLTLDCNDELQEFYAKNNFVRGANMLSIKFRT